MVSSLITNTSFSLFHSLSLSLSHTHTQWAIPGLFFLYFRLFLVQLAWNKYWIKVADNWIRTVDLWYQKRPLYQLSHNHCPHNHIVCPQDKDLLLTLYNSHSKDSLSLTWTVLNNLHNLICYNLSKKLICVFSYQESEQLCTNLSDTIRTRNFLFISLLPQPLDQHSRPSSKKVFLIGQPRPLFVYIRFFQQQFTEKTASFSRIRTQVVRVTGQHADP